MFYVAASCPKSPRCCCLSRLRRTSTGYAYIAFDDSNGKRNAAWTSAADPPLYRPILRRRVTRRPTCSDRAFGNSLHHRDQALSLPWEDQIGERLPLHAGRDRGRRSVVVSIQHNGTPRRQSK